MLRLPTLTAMLPLLLSGLLLPQLSRLLPPHLSGLLLLHLSRALFLLLSELLPPLLLPATPLPATTAQSTTLLCPMVCMAHLMLPRTVLFNMLSSVRLRLTQP